MGHGTDAGTMLNTNLHGPRRVCQSFLPLLDRSNGRIVNVGSGSGPKWLSEQSEDIKRVLVSADVTWGQIEAVVEEQFAIHGASHHDARGMSKRMFR